MRSSMRLGALVGLGLSLAPIAAHAAPADEVRARVAHFRDLGDALKTVNDALRRNEIKPEAMQNAARKIVAAAHDQYTWFPPDSHPQPGLKTSARPEIWSKPAEFRIAQDGLAHQADAFLRAANSGDPAAIRAEGRKLGGACKACHESFRTPDD